jgi:hypothetical protein
VVVRVADLDYYWRVYQVPLSLAALCAGLVALYLGAVVLYGRHTDPERRARG